MLGFDRRCCLTDFEVVSRAAQQIGCKRRSSCCREHQMFSTLRDPSCNTITQTHNHKREQYGLSQKWIRVLSSFRPLQSFLSSGGRGSLHFGVSCQIVGFVVGSRRELPAAGLSFPITFCNRNTLFVISTVRLIISTGQHGGSSDVCPPCAAERVICRDRARVVVVTAVHVAASWRIRCCTEKLP